jgi:hypothetical protein
VGGSRTRGRATRICDEQIELRTAAEIPVADELGHDGVRQWATDVWEVFSEFHNEVVEVIDGADRETVVTVVRTNGLMREMVRGAFEDVRWELLDIRGSGDRGVMHFRMTGTLGTVPVEHAMWQAVVLRDGKGIWWAFFRTEHEALEAVGLRE